LDNWLTMIFFLFTDQIDEKNKEIEIIKGKLSNKETFFNKKLLRLTQCEFTIDKLNKELTNESTAVKDLKSENSKILLKLAEQSNRYKEMKFKNDELNKTIESKVSFNKKKLPILVFHVLF
jgi:hypothetical protein